MTLYRAGFGFSSHRLSPLAVPIPFSPKRVLYAGWACFVVEDDRGKAVIYGKHSQHEQDLVSAYNTALDENTTKSDEALQDNDQAAQPKFFGWGTLRGFLDSRGNVIGLGHGQPLYKGARDVASCGAPLDQMTVILDEKTQQLFSWTALDPTLRLLSLALSSSHSEPSTSSIAVKPNISQESPSTVTLSHPEQEPRFEQVWAGESHFLALAKDGTLYSWGSARFGQLGHGELRPEPLPKPIESLQGIRITSATCGAAFSAALSGKSLVAESGDIYTFGLDDHGQLGLGEMQQQRPTAAQPHLVDFLDATTGHIIDVNVVQVGCGSAHLVALDDKGNAWSCGWGKYGQLALGTTAVADGVQIKYEEGLLQFKGVMVAHDDQCQMQRIPPATGAKPWINFVCGLWSTFLWTE